MKPTAIPAWQGAWRRAGWNAVRVRIEGHAPQIQLWLNGAALGALKAETRHAIEGGTGDMEAESSGFIALELPTGPNARTPAVRNVALKPLP